MKPEIDYGWRILRIGAAGLPQALYSCHACGTVSYFDVGNGQVPDPHCCAHYNSYPVDIPKFRDFLRAQPVPPETEAQIVAESRGKSVTEVSLSSRNPFAPIQPLRPNIQLIARHRGRPRK